MEKLCHNCGRENAEDDNNTFQKCWAWLSDYNNEEANSDCHWHEVLTLREKVKILEIKLNLQEAKLNRKATRKTNFIVEKKRK